LTYLVIDAGQILVPVLGRGQRRNEIIPKIGKWDELIQKVHGRFGEPRGWKKISWKRGLSQRVDELLGRQQFREIPRPHGGRRDGGGTRGGRTSFVRALPRAEKEGFVFANGAAELRAELVAFEDRGGGGEKGARVEVVVADELERAAVKLVAPRFGDRVDRGSAVAAEF